MYNDTGGTNTGVAYLFGRNQGGADSWGQIKALRPTLVANGDVFGSSVAIDGDTVLVGAYGEESAYIFERNQGGVDSWGQVKKLTASDGENGDRFGFSAALSGSTAVVGAKWNDDAGGESGSAYVFERNLGGPESWGEATKLTASDAAEQSFFGASVAIDADTILVGAYYHDVITPLDRCGAAYVFSRDLGGADQWGEVVRLTAAVTSSGNFGVSVAIDGTAAIIGAYQDQLTQPVQGTAFVFTADSGGTWSQLVRLVASDPGNTDFFGYGVDLSGSTAAVGAYQGDEGGINSGAAYLYLDLPTALFVDGFESADVSAWSSSRP
jgi:hypothetical protein